MSNNPPNTNKADLPPLPFGDEIWERVSQHLALPAKKLWIVELILRRQQDKQIMDVTGMAFPTVRSHLKEIFLRTGVEDRTALVIHIFAITIKLINPDNNQS